MARRAAGTGQIEGARDARPALTAGWAELANFLRSVGTVDDPLKDQVTRSSILQLDFGLSLHFKYLLLKLRVDPGGCGHV